MLLWHHTAYAYYGDVKGTFMVETMVTITAITVAIASFAIAIREQRREAVRIPVRVGKPRKNSNTLWKHSQ